MRQWSSAAFNSHKFPIRPTPSANIRWKALLALPIVLLLVACDSFSSVTDFNGTPLKDSETAPDFNLTNQLGESVSLGNFKDRVVVLTFLYTNCPDTCPVVTSQLREVGEILRSEDSGAQFVAVSVDPGRDTVESAREYLDKWGLSEDWHFLVGERPELEEVWRDYYVGPAVSNHDPLESGRATPSEPRGAIDSLSAEIRERYLVVHSTPVFLIDRQGNRRVVFTPPLRPEEMAQDIRRLLDTS